MTYEIGVNFVMLSTTVILYSHIVVKAAKLKVGETVAIKCLGFQQTKISCMYKYTSIAVIT